MLMVWFFFWACRTTRLLGRSGISHRGAAAGQDRVAGSDGGFHNADGEFHGGGDYLLRRVAVRDGRLGFLRKEGGDIVGC